MRRPVVYNCGVRLNPYPPSRPRNKVQFLIEKDTVEKKDGGHQDEQCGKPGHPPIVSCAGLPLV